MESVDPSRVIESVSRRAGLLFALRDGDKSKPELAGSLPVSRSTVDRAVRQMESVGLVTRDQGDVSLTLGGRLALSEYEAFRDGIEGLGAAWEVLSPIPPDAGLDLAVFKDAEIVSSKRHAPHQPVQAVQEFLRNAEEVRGVASAVLPEYVDLYSTQIIESGMETTLTIPPAVLQTLVSEFRGPLESSLETGRLTLFEADRKPPFSAIIAHHDDPELGLVIYSESGTTGFIRNSSERAVEWARDWIDAWEQRGDPIQSPGFE